MLLSFPYTKCQELVLILLEVHVCVFHGLVCVCVCDDSVKLDPLLRKEYSLLKQYRL